MLNEQFLSIPTKRISPSSSLSFDDTATEDDDVTDACSQSNLPNPAPGFFHDGKQTLCAAAAGGVCKQSGHDLPSTIDQSLCIVCDLAMHNPCKVNCRDWILKTAKQEGVVGSKIIAMFPPNTRDKISTAFPDQSHLVICLSCVKDIEDANFIGILGGSTTPAGGGKKKRATTSKKKAATARPRTDTSEGIDWEEVIPSMTWENIVVSTTECNMMMNKNNSPLLTKLKGFTVGDRFVEIYDIRVIPLQLLAKQVGVLQAVGSMNKPGIVDLVIELHASREMEKVTGVVVPNNVAYDADRNIWNVPRVINVIFSDDFKD